MDEKQEHITTVAEKIFVRFGFRKTTVDEIAKAAGMGKSTLYYYFKSKEEIFAAVIRRDAQEILHKLAEAINNSATPQEQFRNYVQTRMRIVQERTSHYAMLKAEYLELYPLIEHERQQFHQNEVDAMAEIVRQGISQGAFASGDAVAAAKMVIVLLRGLEDQWFINQSAACDLEQELPVLLNILLKGIERRSDTD